MNQIGSQNGAFRQLIDDESNEPPYNAFQIPPSLILAKKHAEAKKVGKYNNNDFKGIQLLFRMINYLFLGAYCQCCNLPISKQEFDINCELDQLVPLGIGVVQFFQFMKLIVIILCVVMITSGFYNIGETANNCKHEDSRCVNIFGIIYFQSFKSLELNVQQDLDIATLFLVIPLLILGQIYLKRKERYYDSNILTVSDYSIMLKNIDQNLSEIQIRNFLEQASITLLKRKVQIAQVMFCYKLKKYIEATFDKNKILNKKATLSQESLVSLKNSVLGKKNQKLDQKEREADFEIKSLENAFIFGQKQSVRCDKVIVTFMKQEDQQDFARIFQISPLNDLLLNFFNWAPFQQGLFLQGKRLKLHRAPEPLDILWENLEVPYVIFLIKNKITYKQKIWKRVKSFAISIVVLIISFLILLGMSYLQNEITKNQYGKFTEQLLGFLVSIVILIINSLLLFILTKLVVYESHTTYTNQSRNLAFQLSWMQFINTALIPFTLIGIAHRYENYDMIYNLVFIFFANAFLTNLIWFFDPIYIYRLYKQRKISKNPRKSTYTQFQANQIFEYPPFFIDEKFAYVNKSYLTCMFYASVFPFGILIELLGLLIFYWLNKYLLLRRSIFPNSISNRIIGSMMKIALSGPLVFSLSNLIQHFIFVEHDVHLKDPGVKLNIICILFSVFLMFFNNYIMNMSFVRKYIIGLVEKEQRDITYDEMKGYFTIDYKDTNPIVDVENKLEDSMEATKITKQFYNQRQNGNIQNEFLSNSKLKLQQNCRINEPIRFNLYNNYYNPISQNIDNYNNQNLCISNLMQQNFQNDLNKQSKSQIREQNNNNKKNNF